MAGNAEEDALALQVLNELNETVEDTAPVDADGAPLIEPVSIPGEEDEVPVGEGKKAQDSVVIPGETETYSDEQLIDLVDNLPEEDDDEPAAAPAEDLTAKLAQAQATINGLENLARNMSPQQFGELVQKQLGINPTPVAAPTDGYTEPEDPAAAELRALREELSAVKASIGQNQQATLISELDRTVDRALGDLKLSVFRKNAVLYKNLRDGVIQAALDPANGVNLQNREVAVKRLIKGHVQETLKGARALIPSEVRRLAKLKKKQKTSAPPSAGPKAGVRTQPENHKPINTWTKEGKKDADAQVRAILAANR